MVSLRITQTIDGMKLLFLSLFLEVEKPAKRANDQAALTSVRLCL